jgi:outer membrane protein OmpA-like peptidoglycan-associated protein
MDLSNLGQSFTQVGLLDTISRFVGGNPEATKKTLNAAIPTTMYAFAEHGSSETGARGLLDALNSGQAPQLDVNDLGRTLTNPQVSDKLLTSSGGFLEHTLGGKLNGIVGGMASYGGTDRSATAKLIAIAAPLALGVIGRHARDNGLDAHGLAGFLSSQKSQVASVLPGPLRSLLGVAGDSEAAKGEVAKGEVAEVAKDEVAKVEMPARETVPHVPEPQRMAVMRHEPAAHAPRRTAWVWALPILAAVLALVWLVETVAHRRNAPRSPNVAGPTTPSQQTPSAQPQPPAPLERASIKPVTDYLATGNTAPQRFSLKELTFATGSSALSNDGRQIASQLAGALKAHPTATVRLEGYSDAADTANTNGSLALARADAVKQALIADGIAGGRIETASNSAGTPNENTSGSTLAGRVDIIVQGGAQQ